MGAPYVSGVAIVLMTFACTFPDPAGATQDVGNNATAVWERAVAAKGGRERLAGIHSFAIRQSTTFKRPVRGVAARRVMQVVCRLPHDWWEFLDYRPGSMGYSVTVVDTRTGLGWATHGQPAREFLRPNTDTAFRMRQLQYVYFLETRSVRPVPVQASNVRIGSKRVVRVETRFEDDVAVFFFDSATYLPVRVETIRNVSLKRPGPDGKLTSEMKFVFELEEYRDVDGVQVPTQVTIGRDPSTASVEINPDYDSAIFTKPPNPGDGIDSWRPKRLNLSAQPVD